MNERDRRQELERAIAEQERLRGTVDDGVLDLTIDALRAQLDALAAPPPDRRRRQATVLFADVRGFTALAERLDAEVVSDVMDDVWARIDQIIVEHGGRIDKHIGDAVMALWGSESSQEGDPEQAVRAALALQEALGEPDDSTSPVMRVGVSTGPVVIGEVATTRELTAMGDTVNVAARLEGAAPPGGVLISHDTYRHVRGVFDVRQLEPLALKGKSNQLVAYLVLRAKPRSFHMATRGVEGVETRMVGRDADRSALERTFEQVVASGRLGAVAVVGDAGVGKSRLLYELENWVELLDTDVFFLKARATAARESVPYGLFRDLVAARFGILDSDPPTSVAAKVRAGFAPHLGAAEAELVGHWLGFDLSASDAVRRLRGSSGFSSTCAAHLADFLRRLAAEDPVLLVLEDLHWADPESLALLAGFVEQLRDERIAVVAASRPPVPGVLAGVVEVLRLEPLGAEDSQVLVDEVLQLVPEVPAAVRDLVVGRADGNPFFVEELIKMLIDDGVIVPGEPGAPWRTDLGRLDVDSVPSTLTGVLESRLDSLPTPQRAVLQHASVIGRVFWDAAVAALHPDPASPETSAGLDTACARELVYRRDRSAIGDATEFIFKHALLRDVTYETVLLRHRQRLHALAAAWLEDHAGERRNEFLELIARHHRLAGQPALAAELHLAAGAQAVQVGRSASARRSLEEAMALWGEAGTEPPAHARLELALACCQLGDFDGGERAIAPLRDAELTPPHEAEVLYLGSWIASARADHDAEGALLARALPIAEQVGGRALAWVLKGIAWHQLDSGDAASAERSARRAWELQGEAGDTNERGQLISLRAAIADSQGDHVTAEQFIREGFALARQTGDLELEAVMAGNLGVVRHLVGDETGSMEAYADAERNYAVQLAATTRLGLEQGRSVCLANLAQVCIRLDRLDDSRRHLGEALRSAIDGNRRAMFALCLLVEADLRLAAGDVAGALRLAGAVQADPMSADNDRQEVVRLLARAGLADDVVAAGMAAGAGTDVEALAHQVLAELAGDHQAT